MNDKTSIILSIAYCGLAIFLIGIFIWFAGFMHGQEAVTDNEIKYRDLTITFLHTSAALSVIAFLYFLSTSLISGLKWLHRKQVDEFMEGDPTIHEMLAFDHDGSKFTAKAYRNLCIGLVDFADLLPEKARTKAQQKVWGNWKI